MTYFAKVESDIVVETFIQLPRNLVTPEGVISNFNKLTDVAAYGYYLIVDQRQVPEAWQERVNVVNSVVGNTVEVTCDLADTPLEGYKAQKITKAYANANNQLDSLVEGYSQLEVATWPMIQADVLAFTATAVIGSYMQAAIDTSGYSAQGLADLLLPRFAEQAVILATRKTAVEAIMLAADHAAVKAVT